MISSKKKFLKRIWSGIIVSIFSVIIASFLVTKVVYDSTFTRYDVIPDTPLALEEMVSDRQSVKFLSGKNKLNGYLYDTDGKGLIVLAPGYHASADDYLWQIKSLTDKGWAVFCFDTTGSCLSEGSSSVGFSQAVYDLRNALDYLKRNDNFGYESIYLLGHSRGGYAVCGVLDGEYDIKAAATVSAVNSSMGAIIQPVESKIGKLAYINYPFLVMYQSTLFERDIANFNAANEIVDSGVPVLVVQGSEDDKYTKDKYSLYAHSVKGGYSNVEYYICDEKGKNGHTSLLFEHDGKSANQALMDEIDRFFKQNK
ncbi:MAG: alpha/beta fold hydrolase [Acutalibacteraceae bacterium]|nr:alpha/beta fold hydrolase [Acutalibacteraceae bacterium]